MIKSGEPVRAYAEGVFQIYPQALWPGPPHLEHDSAAPSLSGQTRAGRRGDFPQARPRPARGKDYCQVLDCGNHVGSEYVGIIET